MPKITPAWLDKRQSPGLHWDSHGLGVRVWKDGHNKTFVYQKSGGRRRTLGRWPAMTLRSARDIAQGGDTAPRRTTRGVHETWSADHLARGGRQNTITLAEQRVSKHCPEVWSQDPATLDRMALTEIRTRILQRSGTHAARDTITHVKRLIEFSTGRSIKMPALPRPQSSRAERSRNLAEWWPEIAQTSSSIPLAGLTVCALTGLRPGEVLQMRRSNIQDSRVLIPQPKARMGRDLSFWRHLPRQLLPVLGELKTGDVIFPLASLRVPSGSHGHRLRHHFIGCAESETGVPRRVLRALVNHTGKTDVTDGYGVPSQDAIDRWSQEIADVIAEKIGLGTGD